MPGLILSPLPSPSLNANRALDPEFGRIVEDTDPAHLSPDQIDDIKAALYKHSILFFPGADVTPEAQLAITQAFDQDAQVYGHGNKGRQAKSILHPDLKTIPRLPQVQVIGNGPVAEHEGLKDVSIPCWSWWWHKVVANNRSSLADSTQASSPQDLPQHENTRRR